ncbi:hypothetical protein [Cohnella silvisoli]|uniref:Reverse transcriptase domain-containing protein n=1 Tax=Cohnella silvisoli TaxID=2873699 RepID=A0ABV1KMC1_9BACL|nr:hypothetical protein [Cohnella silvisoli]MCD9020440.1 hypothetical protein [Cohnella silvisoli]
MAMEPIWESDFHPVSYGFRPARSVHHAIRTVKMQLQDGNEQTNATTGRWVIEGDLAHEVFVLKNQARQKLRSKEGYAIAVRRMIKPEPVFGDVKNN